MDVLYNYFIIYITTISYAYSYLVLYQHAAFLLINWYEREDKVLIYVIIY